MWSEDPFGRCRSLSGPRKVAPTSEKQHMPTRGQERDAAASQGGNCRVPASGDHKRLRGAQPGQSGWQASREQHPFCIPRGHKPTTGIRGLVKAPFLSMLNCDGR